VEEAAVGLHIRVATLEDVPALEVVMEESITELQLDFLTPQQIEASRSIMGLDHQLIEDGTYYVVELDGHLAGCGGWSRRATLFGSDHTPGRDAHLLDPATDPARVRAMYTRPRFARRGVGRCILERCEADTQAEGFTRLELMGTLAGRPLYEAYGFVVDRHVDIPTDGGAVPAVHMTKPITRRSGA
jgi:GNAT superfamily N-acetyltransferase